MTSVENTSPTKNIKDNRKVVVATYYTPVAVFKLPDGIDLADQNFVEGWTVRYGSLHIYYVDGHEEKIEPYHDADIDWKEPQEAEIEDADEYCVEYSEDEEEEDEDDSK